MPPRRFEGDLFSLAKAAKEDTKLAKEEPET
jgi:hypothetical protein